MISIETAIIIAVVFVGIILIVPSKGERTFIFRGKVLTLKQIVEQICYNGVVINVTDDSILVEYHHDPDAIENVIEKLQEAELPVTLSGTAITISCPI